jgi:hypothetical protein
VVEMRRRLPRQDANWQGKYTVEGGTPGVWGACEILDISILGTGLELFEDPQRLLPTISDLIGRPILVEVQTPAGASISFQMMGEIRYTTPGNRGGVRVGLEFSQLSETEQAILNVLESMQAVW